MCFVLFMASDKPRREIPWDEKAPSFHVKADDACAMKTRRHFSKPHVYYLGSSSMCGCNFRREPDWVFDQLQDEERRTKQENQEALHSFLAECLDDEPTVELLGCWSGNEEKPLQNRRNINLDDLLSGKFFFDDDRTELIIVQRQANDTLGGARQDHD